MVYPTLTKLRLHKALIYSKSEYGLKDEPLTRNVKEAIIGISKYLSLWLAGGWVDPTSRRILPPMYQRDSM